MLSTWPARLIILSSLVGSIHAQSGLISLDLKSTDDGQLFYVEVGVGQRDERQTFKLLPSTTTGVTWIPSAGVNPTNGYTNKTQGFDPRFCVNLMKSGTHYGGYQYSVHNDTWQINPQLQVERQQFALVHSDRNYRHLHTDFNVDGVLGMSSYEDRPKGTHYLFRNLFQLGLIQRLQFSLFINSTGARESCTAGKLILGGAEARYLRGEFKFVRTKSVQSYGSFAEFVNSFHVSSVQLDWSRTNEQTKSRGEIQRLTGGDGRIELDVGNTSVRLDSTTKLFVGPVRVVELIHMDFIGATKIGTNGLYVFDDCRRDNKPDLVFTVDDLELVITPDDYVVHHELDGRRVCLSGFLGQTFSNSWSFGTKFLRKYYLLFDYEKQVIGFGTPAT